MKIILPDKYVTEDEKQVPVVAEADVVVVGGGPAGIAAALAAARTGANVCVVEAHGCLGGMWTAGLLTWMFEMDQPGLPREITKRLGQRNARIAGHDPNMYTYDIEEMKLLLEDICEETNVRFQLHTRARACVMQDGKIDAVITESKSGAQAWRAKAFVDASGDGDLAALAGCGYDLGKNADGVCQPMTYKALVAVRDLEAAGPFISFWEGGEQHRHKTVNYEAVRAFRSEIRRAGIEPSYSQTKMLQVRGNLLALMVNHEYGVSAIEAADLTRATVHGRAEVHRVVKGLQKLGGVWSGLQLVATCEQIGVREGRRIHGLYTVSHEDLAVGRVHKDAVCKVHFGIDIHSTNGANSKGQDVSRKGVTMQPYDIPMRALVARDVSNLLLGGRCISGDFIAHSSYRVTGTAAATGQAAGVAAALCANLHTAPFDLKWEDIKTKLDAITGSEPAGSGNA
ncbi:MAG: FAD-dependent oxidoreductase [Verrucomicrobiota bacterium]